MDFNYLDKLEKKDDEKQKRGRKKQDKVQGILDRKQINNNSSVQQDMILLKEKMKNKVNKLKNEIQETIVKPFDELKAELEQLRKEKQEAKKKDLETIPEIPQQNRSSSLQQKTQQQRIQEVLSVLNRKQGRR